MKTLVWLEHRQKLFKDTVLLLRSILSLIQEWIMNLRLNWQKD